MEGDHFHMRRSRAPLQLWILVVLDRTFPRTIEVDMSCSARIDILGNNRSKTIVTPRSSPGRPSDILMDLPEGEFEKGLSAKVIAPSHPI